MKKDIHPTYYPKVKVVCACGNTFAVGSTQKEIRTEICASCHPFYTGKQNLVDTAGRVERFEKIMASHKKATEKIKSRTTKKAKVKTGSGENDKTADNQTKLKQIKKRLDSK